MADAAHVTAVVTAIANAVAALYGAWRWWTVSPSRVFWVLARVGQGFVVVQAIAAGVLFIRDFLPGDGLYWLYAVLPLIVSFLGEQFRVTSAHTVLDARGLEDAQAVGRLDEAGQRSVVLAILRREMGVVALAAAVVAFLSLRALGTA
jgi:hypothetical protein